MFRYYQHAVYLFVHFISFRSEKVVYIYKRRSKACECIVLQSISDILKTYTILTIS